MTTQLFFRLLRAGIHRGTNTAKLDGTTTNGWQPYSLLTTRGGSASGTNVTTSVTGPTSGIEAGGTTSAEFYSLPLDADVTISGTITCNLWGSETSMNANAAINAVVERLDNTGAIISTIAQTARTIEVATAAAVNNFTVTPTSTAMLKGERIRVRVYFDDSVDGNMGSGFGLAFRTDGPTAAADGDSYITFTETFSVLTTEPAGSILYLTSTTGPAVGANDEREMWTSRGGSAATAIRNTATGWTAPLQWTATAGGTAIEWYSKPLTAFTLSDLVRLNLRAHESNASANATIRAELAVCNGDGTGAVVFGAADLIDTASPGGAAGTATSDSGELTTTEAAVKGWIAGSDIAVTNGQRLRLRLYVDDYALLALATGFTATVTYNGTSGGASGDTWIQLGQTVSEYSSTPERPPWSRNVRPRGNIINAGFY